MSFATYGQEMLSAVQANPYGAQLLAFLKANAALAPLVTFLLAFGEALAVIGALIPATIVLIAVGALVGATDIEFWPIWAGAAAGAVLGDYVSYWFGFRFKDRARTVWPLARYPDMYARGDRFFRKWGPWSLFIGRFFGPLRGIVPLIAGVFQMPVMLFLMANTASAMLWAFVLLAPGFAAISVLQQGE